MARLYINPGNKTYGPVPGGELTDIIGSNQAERIWLARNANVTLDPSWVRANDTAVILGLSTNCSISATVAGITITSGNGASIRIPAFGTDSGLKIQFNDGFLDLGTDDGGTTFQLTGATGAQEIGNVPTVIGSGGSGGSGDVQSIDIGTPAVARTLDASQGDIIFTDDASATTNVRITNLTEGDRIAVTNATASGYNFQRSFTDTNDLVITYTDPVTGAPNVIVIDDILPVSGAVSSLVAATATIGFNFMSFG